MSPWNETSDTSLLVAVGRFEQDALAEIYRRHGGPVHNLALRVIQDRQLADDITQEVFVDLWNDPTRFDAGPGLPTLLAPPEGTQPCG